MRGCQYWLIHLISVRLLIDRFVFCIAEADKELAEKISQRGFSASEDPKEKPSEVMTTLDDYVTNGIYR